jgi:hypothetical protein
MNHRAQCALLAAGLTASIVSASAQDIPSLDLTGVVPRLELRYPIGPPAMCDENGACRSGGFGSVALACGGAAPGELRVNLSYMDRSEYVDGDEAEIEVILQNTGAIPLEIPWSPNLADLQPADESARFAVYELQVGLFVNWGADYSISVGWLNLYGDRTHPGTIVTLNPGESARIRGNVKLSFPRSDAKDLPALEFADRASAGTVFRKVEYLLRPGEMFEQVINASPKQAAGVSKPMHILTFGIN